MRCASIASSSGACSSSAMLLDGQPRRCRFAHAESEVGRHGVIIAEPTRAYVQVLRVRFGSAQFAAKQNVNRRTRAGSRDSL